MSEVMTDIYSAAYNYAMNSGATEEEARVYARECCYELESCLIYD